MKYLSESRLNYILIFCLSFLPIVNTFCCTGILLKTKNGSCVYARTLEFGRDIQSKVLFVPRNYNFSAATDKKGITGLTWNSKYAVLGANVYGTPNYVDGVNEKGLAGGLFYFPGFAQYQNPKEDNYKNSIPMWQLLTWILTNFENVDDIKKELPKIYVTNAVLPQFKGPVPAHLIIHDESGKSLVIEYLKGKLSLKDNPLGVFTNSPDFDWHMTNLRNYINLSPVNSKPKNISGIEFSQLGQGSGMLGLPGDFTPPSRFVRAAQFVQAAPKKETEADTIYQAFHILNNFDIPEKSVVDEDGSSEITQWTSATDLKNKSFYFKTHANFQLQKVELMKLDLDSKETKQFPMEHKNTVIEIN